MFYSNLLKNKKVVFKRYKYADFTNGISLDYDENLTPIKCSRNTYNFNYNNGALTTGMGIRVPVIYYTYLEEVLNKSPVHPRFLSFTGTWKYTYYRTGDPIRYYSLLIVYSTDGFLYFLTLHTDNKAYVKIQNIQLTSKPEIMSYKLNGKNLVLIVNETEGMYTWDYDNGITKYDKVPIITSMCVHYERMFVTTNGEKTQVWFSDDLDPTNFNTTPDEGGFIELSDERGRSNKVLTFDDYVYVVRDYGFSKISAYGDQNDFQVYNLFVSSGRILHKTAVVCGDKIVYLATDGLYMYDGAVSQKLDYSIFNLIDKNYNEEAVAQFSNGSYYLHCNLNYPDGDDNPNHINNSLIKIDLSSGEISVLRNMDIKNIAAIDDIQGSYMLVCIYDPRLKEITLGEVDMSGKVFDVPTHKVWSSPMTDFGYPDKDKYVKEMYLYTKTDITLKVYYDNKSKDIFVKGKDKNQTVKINVKAKKFRVDFVCDEVEACVSCPEVCVGVL